MALKKKPVTGMKDILPAEMEIRDYVIRLIKETYSGFGFSSIETPCVEHIENLSSKQGGENEKLIFKILKRGEKLKLESAESEADLVDGGLRYDLTVPLSRYYANHANELPSPFKALQMGNVWRADRPQRGRYRQFMQCDIDILGEPSNLAEIELILATTTLLGRLDFKNFTIRINDRRILKAMAAYSGFEEESFDTVFIILDKMDKIGMDGVRQELEKEGFAKESIDKYLDLFEKTTRDAAGVRWLKEALAGYLDPAYADGLELIMDSVDAVKTADFRIAFDPAQVYLDTLKSFDMEQLTRYLSLDSLFSGDAEYKRSISQALSQQLLTYLDYQILEESISEDKTTATVSMELTSCDCYSIMENYQEQVLSYAQTSQALQDGISGRLNKANDILISCIQNNTESATTTLEVNLENDGSGWNLKSDNTFSEALLGNISEAMDEVLQQIS